MFIGLAGLIGFVVVEKITERLSGVPASKKVKVNMANTDFI